MKLLVLPSRSEGLPTIMLEAMACGTPVLITQSCAIADYVKDGYTGFILSDTSPKAISNDIIRAIRNPNLKSIVENAKNIIDNLFSYQSAIDRWKKIIDLQFDKK
jgi:glycosyltransferase involved in cell wall biosynthesis